MASIAPTEVPPLIAITSFGPEALRLMQLDRYREITGKHWSDSWRMQSELAADKTDRQIVSAVRPNRITRLEVFQRLFCSPADWIVFKNCLRPPQGKLPYSTVEYPGNTRWADVSVLGTFPDSKKLGDKIAVKLGILPGKNEEKISAQMRRERKKSAASMEKLKGIFEAVVPLSMDGFRVLRIAAAEMDLVPRTLTGSIIFIRTKTSRTAPEGVETKVAQIFDSAYTAYRKTSLVDMRNRKELDLLTRMSVEVKRFADTVDREWKRPVSEETKTELKKQAAEQVAEWEKTLKKSLNPYKLKAYQSLLKIAALQDKRKVDNPSVSVNSMSVALKGLSARLSEVTHKDSFNHKDGTILQRAISAQEAILLALGERAERAAGYLKGHSLFDGSQKTATEIGAAVKALNIKIDLNATALSNVTLKPFIYYVPAIRRGIHELEVALFHRDYEAAAKSLQLIATTVRVFSAQKLLEDIKIEITANPNARLEDLRESFSPVLVKLQNPLPLLQPTTEPSSADKLSHLLIGINRNLLKITFGLRTYHRKNLSQDQRKEKLAGLKLHVTKLSTELIQMIPSVTEVGALPALLQ